LRRATGIFRREKEAALSEECTLTIRFGTDGWHAVKLDTFTFANLRLVTQAIADYVLEEGGAKPQFVIGFDTRFLSAR